MNYSLFEELCKKNKTSPTALSKKIGLSKGNTSNWKNGGNPSVDILCKIADELNCTTDALLGREENQTIKLMIDEQELLENYRQLNYDKKEKASIAIQELKIQDTSNEEHNIKPVIPYSNVSKINIYEQDLLKSFRELPFGEQMKIIGKVETLAEMFKSEENVG